MLINWFLFSMLIVCAVLVCISFRRRALLFLIFYYFIFYPPLFYFIDNYNNDIFSIELFTVRCTVMPVMIYSRENSNKQYCFKQKQFQHISKNKNQALFNTFWTHSECCNKIFQFNKMKDNTWIKQSRKHITHSKNNFCNY